MNLPFTNIPITGDRREIKESNISGVLAIMTTIMVALAALTPYVVVIPKDNLNLITQAQTTLWNGWLVILGFYFSSSISSGKKDEAIKTLAQTAKTAQETLSATAPATTTLAPGETATIKAEGETP